jgi:transcription elongation GreA/GreB family factor
MNRLGEFYESNHLLVLITVVVLFGIYISSIKNRKRDVFQRKVKLKKIKKIKESPISESSFYSASLPIELIPNDSEDFLQILLKTKEAEIITYYQNGTKDSKIWNASNMSAESNVIRNLRSRPEFRNPNWQKANIVKVVVEVIKNNKEEIDESDVSEVSIISEASNDEMQSTEFSQLKEADDEIPYAVSKRIRIGSTVQLKYISTNEIISILISKYQAGKIENKPEIKWLYCKNPLAVALLNKEAGDRVEFKLNDLDENEVKVEVLAINNDFVDDFEEEIINNEVNQIMPEQNRIVHPIAPLQDMSEGFRRWLSRGNNNNGKNYAPGTVLAYSNAIIRLSEHLTERIGQRVNIYNLSIQSIGELERIKQLYSLLGKYSEFGNTAHGTYRNAMVAYVHFIKSLNRN